MNGIILKAISGFYYVLSDKKLFECKARGSFRKSGVSPLVGDRVEFETDGNEKGVLNEILPRKSCLMRPPVANIDKLFIVSAFENPAPNTLIIDKMTAIAEYNNIEPVIVFNKSDMGDTSEWERIYRHAGFKAFTVSALTGDGKQALIKEISDCICAFTGNSGVGKSSIINSIYGDLSIETGEISRKLGRGRHTTRHTELYASPYGGFVADTPGFSSLEQNNSDYEFKEQLPYLFRDFTDYLTGCKFASCTHTKESGCAVLKAVEDGNIEQSRHKSYLELFNEMKDFKPWNTVKHKKQ